MSSQSLLGLPPVSPALKAIVPFLQRANEIQTQDPVMAYWCAYHAAQLGISLKAKDSPSRDILFALLGFLEELKRKIGPSDALDIEPVSSAYVENFAFKVFALADNEDRSGSATRATAKKFLAAAHFLEVLKNFPKADISESTEEKIKYAKWKAADIAKAFREGRKPTPGPAGSNLAEDSEASHIKDAQIGGDEHRLSIPIEYSPSASVVEVPQVPSAPLPHTPPHFPRPYLDARSFEQRIGTPEGSTGEPTPGSWSTAATPGTIQGPSEHREEQGSFSSGPSTQRPRVSNRKAWVSEELEGKDESEYLGLSLDTPAVDTAEGPAKPGGFEESVSAESFGSLESSSMHSSPAYGEQNRPYVAVLQPNWTTDEPASDHQSQPSHTQTVQQSIDLDTFPSSLVPNSHSHWPTGTVEPSHLGHVFVSPSTAQSIETQPGTLPPHHNLYTSSAPPPALSQQQQNWPPPSSIAVELTPSIIAKAQKHCRFAISSLDYEDAEQARKELRAALAILGDT